MGFMEPFARDVPPGLVTRRATEADLGRAVELIARGAVPGATSGEDVSDLTSYRAALRDIGDTNGAVLVAELDGEVVGICQLIVFRHLQARGGLCGEIESVHVHTDYRGRGIGSVLVRDAVSRARALGCYRVQLTSNRARPKAHHFYEHLGFAPSHVGFKLPLR
jgi:GNAT superfamily N-acetyltransferase